MLQLYTCTSCRFFFLREANPFYFSYVPSMTKNDVMIKTPLPGLKILFTIQVEYIPVSRELIETLH